MICVTFSETFWHIRLYKKDASFQVKLFKHPHLLLLQVRNSIFKLPGGRLRLGESGRWTDHHTSNRKGESCSVMGYFSKGSLNWEPFELNVQILMD